MPSYQSSDRDSKSTAFHPTTFLRHNRQLRALLLETQPWFSARDLSKLIAWPLNERTTSKLDPDQRRTLWLESHGRTEEALMISESGVYALLVHHYHPEHRSLRHWITNEVVAALRDAQEPPVESMPSLSLLQWPGLSLSMLHWQSEPWIRLRDVPQVLPVSGQGFEGRTDRSDGSWWQGAARFFQVG
ncbi:Bro-N domain-containing protein [Pseudomonas sp. NPDC089734]|uniref:BRO-N domain-containing protein n=1 Tax=Pseudomonas sp. NPDC089734 TaxID=3364469 RepID=UPI003816A1E9